MTFHGGCCDSTAGRRRAGRTAGCRFRLEASATRSLAAGVAFHPKQQQARRQLDTRRPTSRWTTGGQNPGKPREFRVHPRLIESLVWLIYKDRPPDRLILVCLPCRRSRGRVPSAASEKAPQIAGLSSFWGGVGGACLPAQVPARAIPMPAVPGGASPGVGLPADGGGPRHRPRTALIRVARPAFRG
jgi:hypothetical protein